MPILAFILSPVGRWLAGAAVVAALIAGAYLSGHHKGAAEADTRWQVAMAAEQRRQTEASARALDAATAREIERAKENEALANQVNDYERALATRPADLRCALSGDDAHRLRRLQSEPAR